MNGKTQGISPSGESAVHTLSSVGTEEGNDVGESVAGDVGETVGMSVALSAGRRRCRVFLPLGTVPLKPVTTINERCSERIIGEIDDEGNVLNVLDIACCYLLLIRCVDKGS